MGRRLAEVRKASGLTRAQFASLFGYSAQRMDNYYAGRRIIDLEGVVWLHKNLGISLDWLIAGTGRKAVPGRDVLGLNK